MAQLKIETLFNAAWEVFGFQHAQVVADRDDFQAGIERRLGQDVAAQIQLHVDSAMGRGQTDTVNPTIMAMRETYELLALEQTIDEVRQRIDANAVFVDPGSLLPIFGLSWHQDVMPLLDGQKSPGSMPIENVRKFLAMVRGATQRVPSEEGIDGPANDDYFRKWRRDLIEFLERAVKFAEPIWCRLRQADPYHS